ncbi:hypothetical protein [Delftia acidovorans]|uniref:hypothetical protein n=1 Tax=Delftia acidovorans TaxID=80866 RepID=UPI001EDD1F56|nr:hypothetical protein [Delftia acidovorans]MCG3783333.1 hypothetical protein [Delftia acidovorans]
MIPAPLLQFTDVRTRAFNGQTLIGIKHTAKTKSGLAVTTTWVDMPPEDVERLIKTLQDTLAELARE